MDERGDGLHNGRNRQNLHLLGLPRGDRPPADQLNAGVLAWMDFLLNRGFHRLFFNILDPENQADNDNPGNDDDSDSDSDEQNDDIVNDHNNNEDNNDTNGVRGDENINDDVDDTDNLPSVSRKRSREEDEERDEESKRSRWWDEFADSGTDSDTDGTDCNDNHTDTSEACPLPGLSRKRSREHGEEDDESCKKARQLEDSDIDSARAGQDEALGSHSSHLAQGPGATDTDADYDYFFEEPQLPGLSRKRSREDEDEGSSRRARLGDRDSNSARTGEDHEDHAPSSHLVQDPGATEESEEDLNQEVEEEDRRPRKRKKKTRL